MSGGSSSDDDPDLIDRLDAGELPRSPEEAAARVPYERLTERLRDLDEIDPPAGWEDRAMARWFAAKRKRRLGILIGTAATSVALAAVLLLQPCAVAHVEVLELAVRSGSGATRRGDAAVGDVLHARVHLDQPHRELRIYLGAAVMARCPGNVECRVDASTLQLDWRLPDAGMYQVVVLSSPSGIPPGDGTIDRDLLDARAAGASIQTRSLEVAP